MSLSTADIMALPDSPQKRAMLVQLGGNLPKRSDSLPKPKANKTELAYMQRLDSLRFNRVIAGYEFEGHKLRLADKTFYTPDFVVWLPNGLVEYHETKGFERDDAAVKFKTAAEKYPFARFLMVRKSGTSSWAVLRDIPARVPAATEER